MAIAGAGDDTKVVVCGPPDGIAGLLAARLTEAGGIREVVLADETETLEQQVWVCTCGVCVWCVEACQHSTSCCRIPVFLYALRRYD